MMWDKTRGVWEWVSRNAHDLGRIANALETIAGELQQIRRALQDDAEREN